MSEPTLTDGIKANTNQLNADDMIGIPPFDVTVIDIETREGKQAWKITIDGGWKPYLPCLTMRRVLLDQWGDDGQKGKTWIGRRMRLFRDPETMFEGKKVGGIRISHLSHMDKPEANVPVTASKGRKVYWTVKRLEDKPNPETPPLTDAEQAYIEDCTAELSQATTMDQLQLISEGLSKKSDGVKNIMRPVYAACAAKLKKTENKEQANG